MSLHPDQLQAEAAFEAAHPGALARYRELEARLQRRERFDRWFSVLVGGGFLLAGLLSCQPAAATRAPALRHVTGHYWAFDDGYQAICYFHELKPSRLTCVQPR